jgi:DNA-binding transcriptional regulator YhcF (GntR family)
LEGNTTPDDRKRSILSRVFEKLNKEGFTVNASTVDKLVQDDHEDYLNLRQKPFLNILKEALDAQLGQLVEFSVKYASYLNTQLDRNWEMIYAADHITITDLLNLKLSSEEL